MPDLLSYRTKFSSLNNCHHLISNSLGAMPDAAVESARDYTRLWGERGVRAWEEEWWMKSRTIGDKIAKLVGADSDTVSMHPNVTSASAMILSCLDYTPERNKIVMVDMEFPSIQYLYNAWAKDRGNVVTIPCHDGVTIPLQDVLDAIDERTLIVPISHVLFRSSYIVDARAIIEKAHSVGALVSLDIFQSIGVIPVDLKALNVDFAVGGLLKWMCGGPGAGFLYVRPDLAARLSPRFTGWFANADPFAFSPGATHYTSGSFKFQTGTTVVPALYTCEPGLDIMGEVGVDRIRQRSMQVTNKILQMADKRNWPTTTPRDPDKRAGTVALSIHHAQEICTELNRRDYLVDYRPNAGIRVSPHFYNTDQEIGDLFAMIEEIQRDKNY